MHLEFLSSYLLFGNLKPHTLAQTPSEAEQCIFLSASWQTSTILKKKLKYSLFYLKFENMQIAKNKIFKNISLKWLSCENKLNLFFIEL